MLSPGSMCAEAATASSPRAIRAQGSGTAQRLKPGGFRPLNLCQQARIHKTGHKMCTQCCIMLHVGFGVAVHGYTGRGNLLLFPWACLPVGIGYRCWPCSSCEAHGRHSGPLALLTSLRWFQWPRVEDYIGLALSISHRCAWQQSLAEDWLMWFREMAPGKRARSRAFAYREYYKARCVEYP